MTRLRRSELSTPASSERMIEKASRAGADLVFLDLEDSVAPAEKVAARERVVAGFTELDWPGVTRAVRVNSVGSEWVEADLEVVARAPVDVVIVPKVRSVEDVAWVDRRLDAIARSEPVGLEVLIEEAEALADVERIARASARLEALILGTGDLAASLGVRTRRLDRLQADPWAYARGRLVVAARAAGVEAVDGPYWGGIDDVDGYRAECELVATLGYSGKWAIHPAQVAPANAAFAPSADEREHAERILAAHAEAEAEGRGAFRLDGVMVDAVDVRLARETLALAERIDVAAGQ